MFKQLKKMRLQKNMIKKALDDYPGGICLSMTDGRPLLVNKAMNDLALIIVGKTILNSLEFWKKLSEAGSHEGVEEVFLPPVDTIALDQNVKTKRFKLASGHVWSFRRQTILADGDSYIQIEAEEITDLYDKSQRLYEDNKKVMALHKRQQQLSKDLVKINIEKEILQAKINIHDQFGNVLVATRKALINDTLDQEYAQLITEWKKAIANMEVAPQNVSTNRSDPELELIKVADLVGCKIEMIGDRPHEQKALLLMYSGIREGLTNAVKHANADTLTVQIEDEGKSYKIRISNNGQAGVKEIREGMGLTNLRNKLEQEGAGLEVISENGVILILTLPKEEGL